MQGKIINVNETKGHGFIEIESGESVFFFLSSVLGSVIPSHGTSVEFIARKSKEGMMASEVTILDEPSHGSIDTQKSNPLKAIAQWMLEAKLENNVRYFHRVAEVDSIENGTRCYIIGGKGTGKTAISEYMHRKRQYNIFSQKLTFKNFPFNELYRLTDDKFTHPNQYITLWKYIIYSSIAKMMSQNANIDSEIRAKLEAVYEQDITRSLAGTIAQWTSGSIAFSVLGTGVGGGKKREVVSNSTPWIDRVEILEQFVERYMDDAKYYVIFDELDEDYRDPINTAASSKYAALLIGLLKAVQDIKSRFPKEEYNVCPLVFLRVDIYDQLMDADRTKWQDLSIRLTWDSNKLKDLLAFRISRAFDAESEIRDFQTAWEMICSTKYIGTRIKRDPFDFITMQTRIRPRDYVKYLKTCAEICVSANRDMISNNVIMSTQAIYSQYLKSEFEDAIHPLLGDIVGVFEVLSRVGKQSFRLSDFAQSHREAVLVKTVADRNPKTVLETLYDFGAIGIRRRSNDRSVFKYMDPQSRLDPQLPILIHRGLFKVLRLI